MSFSTRKSTRFLMATKSIERSFLKGVTTATPVPLSFFNQLII